MPDVTPLNIALVVVGIFAGALLFIFGIETAIYLFREYHTWLYAN